MDFLKLNDYAARLDRLCLSIENGASWESAGHLRNRTIFALRSVARELSKEAAKEANDEPV